MQTEVSTEGQRVVPGLIRRRFGIRSGDPRRQNPVSALSWRSACRRRIARIRQIGIIGATREVGSDHFQALALGIGHFPDPVMLRIWLALSRTRKSGK